MKRLSLYALALASLVLTACEGGNTPVKPDAEGTTYPRIQLVEHFTGQSCGWCPYGMNFIQEVYAQAPENIVWVSNHTYYTDNFSISESKTIASKLGVGSAPLISINRARYGSGRTYHPGYISKYLPKEATTATSTIEIKRTYDPASRELKLTVIGKTSDPNLEGGKLTVGITESGVVDVQADYMYSWEGWTKFRHTHAIRTYLSAAMGDEFSFSNRVFTKEYTFTLDSKWNADNCEIVAWITKGNYDVLNAAKKPVVEGAKGGEDIVHGGIEEFPVPDTYPESGKPDAEVVMSKAGALYYDVNGNTVMFIASQNTDTVVKTVNSIKLYPYFELYLLLPSGTTRIPAGTYNLVDHNTAKAGDAIAGFRNDEVHMVEGSRYLHVYFDEDNDLSLAEQWMLASGTITFSEIGYEITATTKNGNPIHATYSGTIVPEKGSSNAAARKRMAMFPSGPQFRPEQYSCTEE